MLKDLANQVKLSKYSRLSNALSQPKMAKDEISRTCKYITFRKQKRLYNVIKIRMLKWRDYAGLSGWCCGSSIVKSCPTLCDPTDCSTPGFPVLHISIESMMPSNHLILCRPHFLLLSIFPIIRVCSNELARHIRWPKYWSFSISPSKVYSGLISFKIDWFDLLAVQGILKIFSSITVQKHQFFSA